MNAYSKFMDISMQSLPEPLTQADQSGYSWLKFAHVAYLLDPEITALSHEAQGVLTRLMAYAAMEVPFSSLPDDMDHLVNMAGFKLPDPDSKAFPKAYQHAQTVIKAVLNAVFIQCNDERYYMPLLANQLTQDVKPAGQQPNNPASAEGTGQDPAQGKKLTASAIRQARYRANKKAKREGITETTNNVTETVTGDTAVTPDNVTHNATVTGVTPTVTDSVTGNVTNEGGKGGDLDSDLKKDLDLDIKNQKHTSANANAVFLSQAQAIFNYWKTTFSKNSTTKFTDDRKVKIIARLKEGYTVDEIQSAIRGCAATSHNVEGGYDDLTLICRTGSKVEFYIQKLAIANKPKPNLQKADTPYFNIPKDEIQKHARPGETEYDCAQRLASNRSNPPNTSSPPEKKPAAVWSIGDKSTLKQIQQLDTSITPERIDAMAKQQGKDRDVVMASLYHTLATEQKKQDIAAAKSKAGQS